VQSIVRNYTDCATPDPESVGNISSNDSNRMMMMIIIIIIEYIIRHDKVCTHLHYSIRKKLGTETAENWYSHIPKPVTEHEDVTVLRNQGIQTDIEVLANRPDIIIKNKDKTCLLIDVAIPSDKNVIQKEAEKKLKYKNLSIEIRECGT
jgi:hypothetical protein